MKKSERQRQFVREHLELFRCPSCQAPMTAVVDNSISCANGHRIDFNRHGYLHFLNGAADTEYGREMFLARRQLLAAGLFKPIVAAVADRLPAQPQNILDVGTGEGTPLLQLAAQRQQAHDTLIGFDISKAGVTLATQLDLDAFFCVADLRQLPFNDESFDSLIELFSPSDYGEFKRVLKPGGRLIKVVPNSDYLVELRRLLYGRDQVRSHYDNQQVVDLFRRHYPDTRVDRVRYQFAIPDGLQAPLVEMTPLHWGRGAKRLTAQDLQTLTAITVDVSVLTGTKAK
ncbi:methyltransferase domain-containing protein [Limosilactobacillus antri]|uniref:methyltransferase domain-containing protein n=1 Tax=Limosilactobacillus antri TaxID=227943 RepID=UPI001F55F30B|nr:methyltransferase domain-containing protein [Limosilactobacillus antri]